MSLCRVRIRDYVCVTYAGIVHSQPFYLNLAESGKAYVQVKQERDSLRANLEQLTRKCILILYPKFFLRCLCLAECLSYFLPSNSGDKASAESRVKELEEALASQRAESKKTLDAAKDAAAVRERGYVERLAGLARDVGG